MATQRSDRNVMGFIIVALIVLAIVVVIAFAFTSNGDRENGATPQPTQPTPILEVTPPAG